jgi:hypothetical protein
MTSKIVLIAFVAVAGVKSWMNVFAPPPQVVTIDDRAGR